MDRLIRTTTEHFLNKLNDDHPYFTPQDLLDAGFPDFLVKRIRHELVRNLQETLHPPATDWADMSTGAVREAWDGFLQAIHQEIRLPASYASPVLESALGDILELMVTPRAFLPDYIFGNESQLDLPTLKKRCEWIVVYTYFASAIPRFMEKKGRDVLTKEQADRIIERLDERVTAHYTSLNWARLFEPWFLIIGDRIDPALFAGFFRDKGKPGVARLFDVEPESVHRTRLIEILSKPQLEEDNEDLDEVDQDVTRVADECGQTTADREITPPLRSETSAERSETSEVRTQDRTVSDTTKRTPDQSVVSQKVSKEKSEPDEGENNLLARYRKANGDEEEDKPLHSRLKRQTDEEEDKPLHARLKIVSGEEDDDETGGKPSLLSRIRPSEEEDDDSETVSIWRRFSETSSPGSSETGKLTGNRKNAADKFSEIRHHVRDMEEVFIEELFGGDENAFLEALEGISRFDNWKEAGQYINREIFNRNKIDIYSDTAIYFTDRMQTCFLEWEK